MDVYEATNGSNIIAVESVPWEDVNKYGVIEGKEVTDRLSFVHNLVEKPQKNPPSNLAIMGRYILNPEIMDLLEHTHPGVGGEIQLTDALQQLAQKQAMYSYMYEGKLYDVGSKIGFLKATVEFAMKNQELSEEFERYLFDYALSQHAIKAIV